MWDFALSVRSPPPGTAMRSGSDEGTLEKLIFRRCEFGGSLKKSNFSVYYLFLIKYSAVMSATQLLNPKAESRVRSFIFDP